jgi:hypothetical protein
LPAVRPELPAAKTTTHQIGIRSRVAAFYNAIWGVASLAVGLAILAAIPVVNLLCLGYLLHGAGRVADTGRLAAGFPGIAKASRIGKIAFGTWLVLWPLRGISQLADAAFLIDPHGAAKRWQIVVTVVLILTVCHILWACVRGGRLRDFLWPAPIKFLRWLRSSGKYVALRDAVCDYLLGLRLPFYWKFGLKGAIGSLFWLVPPIAILLTASKLPEGPAAALSFIGGLALLPAAIYLPLLQVRFAQTGTLNAFQELGTVRDWFGRQPMCLTIGTGVVLASAVPLYLLKIELTPEEIRWLPALVFTVFAWPARLLIARLAAVAQRRDNAAHWAWRWIWRLVTLGLATGYVLAVYLSQYLSWEGTASLLDQHAFLVPGP